jgi:hypothetical protein
MEFVDLSNTYIDAAARLAPKAGSEVLAESSDGPLILASATDKKRILVAFSLLSSDFPLQVGFPIFIANALDYMASSRKSGQFVIEAGKTVSIPAIGTASGSLQGPLGAVSVSADSGAYILRELNRAGKYVFEAENQRSTLYANLLNEQESDIGPTDSLVVNSQPVAPSMAPARIADFWKPLLLLCLIVLAGEWWLFAKKS